MKSLVLAVGLRQGYIMSQRLFNIFEDGCARERRAEVGYVSVRLNLSGVG